MDVAPTDGLLSQVSKRSPVEWFVGMLSKYDVHAGGLHFNLKQLVIAVNSGIVDRLLSWATAPMVLMADRYVAMVLPLRCFFNVRLSKQSATKSAIAKEDHLSLYGPLVDGLGAWAILLE